MSRPPLEDALPAAYPSPGLEPEREKILHARLDETLAEARAEATRCKSKRASKPFVFSRFVFTTAFSVSIVFLLQRVIIDIFLQCIAIPVESQKQESPIHEITYSHEKNHRFPSSEYWRFKNKLYFKSNNTNYILLINDGIEYQLQNYALTSSRVQSPYNPKPKKPYTPSLNRLISHNITFSGFKRHKDEFLIGIRINNMTFWHEIKSKEQRLTEVFNKDSKLETTHEFYSGETPPPGIFDPERLKAMAKRAHSTAPTRPR